MKKGKKKAFIVTCSVLGGLYLLYFLGGYASAILVSDALFAQRQSDPSSRLDDFSEATFSTRRDYPRLAERVEVEFPSQGNTLHGYFYSPEDPKGTFLFAHGLKGWADDCGAMIQDFLLREGYCVFAFDMRASGNSGGEGLTSLADGAYDVKSALDYLFAQNEFYAPMGELFLAGYSWGAYSVGAALNFDYPSPVKGVLAFSGFVDPEAEMIEMARNYIGPLADFNSLTLDWGLATKAGEDRRLSASKGILSSNCKAFLVQGDEDKTVPLESSLYSSMEESEKVRKILRKGFTHTRPWIAEESKDFCEGELRPLFHELGREGYLAYLKDQPDAKKKANQIDEDLLRGALSFLVQ